MQVELQDGFWAPRLEVLRHRTLPVMLERLEEQGVVDNLRRLAGRSDAPRRAMHFSDSDLFSWMEACAIADRLDLADEAIELIEAVQHPDGYVSSAYGAEGLPPRYLDLELGHEQYCQGHLIEAAVSHHAATGSHRLLDVAVRVADHLCATFGPGGDERTDGHPEVELALCRLAEVTGHHRYVDQAAWSVDARLATIGATLETYRLAGHAVRALYLCSAVAEVAAAIEEPRWREAAERLYRSLLDEHTYPTGGVGGRWMGESVGRPFEQPDAASYTESCAAVAAAQLAWRMWHLTGDPIALDHLELLLFNAVPCGVGARGDEWFYSQPHAVAEVAAETDPWVEEHDWGQLMAREWFPARRHRWFLVPCCPPNLAREFATVPHRVAEVVDGDLLVHVPVAGRIRADGWDVTISGGYPFDGEVSVVVAEAPPAGQVRVRRPGWAGGAGHQVIGADGRFDLPVDWTWWTTDHRVEGGATAHLRRGPVVHALQGVDHPDVDLRDLVVDPTQPPLAAFHRRSPAPGLHHPVDARTEVSGDAVEVRPIPYADWADAGATTLRVRFPLA